MRKLAWAAEVVEDNYQAILSEAGRVFDRAFLESWVATNGAGYFLRDDTSPLDCLLFTQDDFTQLYRFHKGDDGAMFRLVIRL